MDRRRFVFGLGLAAGLVALEGCAPKTKAENDKAEDVLSGPPVHEKGKAPNANTESEQ